MIQRKIKYGYVLALFSALLSLSSCGDTAIYDNAHNFENRVWSVGDTARFSVDVTDTLQAYDFVITLRNTTRYPWSNLWVHIASTAPDGVTSKVAQRIQIARPDGSWIGRVSGTIVESKLHYRTTTFPLPGTYTFAISQATQEEQIDEVLDISLRIEPSMR